MKYDYYVDNSGKRIDGRLANEFRDIKIETGVVKNADGSVYLEWGINKIIAAVYGPKEMFPRHMADPKKAVIKFNYRMAPFSVSDRKNPKPGRREIEISKVCGEALSHAVILEEFPNSAIEVHVTVLDSNAGTRIAGLVAASVALADAGIPMRDMVSGVAVGRAQGHLIVDLNKHEEDAPDAVDMAVAMLVNTKEVVLLQMDGVFSQDEFNQSLKLAYDACEKIKSIQTMALKKKFESSI